MSMKATVRSSESTVWLGTEPPAIPQKRQSSAIARGSLSGRADPEADLLDLLDVPRHVGGAELDHVLALTHDRERPLDAVLRERQHPHVAEVDHVLAPVVLEADVAARELAVVRRGGARAGGLLARRVLEAADRLAVAGHGDVVLAVALDADLEVAPDALLDGVRPFDPHRGEAVDGACLLGIAALAV